MIARADPRQGRTRVLAPAARATAVVALLLAPGALLHAQDDLAARVAGVQARLAAIEQRADRVADVNAIENLQRSYGYYLDKMLWEHVVDLFSDAATMEIGTSGVYVGKDSIRRYLYSLSGGVEGPLEGVLYDHFQLQPVVTVADDGRTAKGRWRALIMTGTYGSGSGGNWGEGPYENEYVKENGVWKISKLHWYATFYVPYEGGWLNSSPDAVRAYSEGRGVTPDRPQSEQYAPYPAAFVPPFHYPNPVSGR
ncbi:MAG TPA: nuclear transport factor 2 family protein [Gammaproteobacteria bacterium]